MRVHAIQAGRLVGNESFLRGEGWAAALRRRRDFEFPAIVYILEHPDGNVAIDTGMSARGWPTPGPMRRILPRAAIEPDEEIGPQMRDHGLQPEDVRTVILTHLDPDHVGGIAHFPDAELLVHRREHDFAGSLAGRMRSRPQDWPAWFEPTLYDLDPEPHGPFPKSRLLTEPFEIRLVPIPGHTVGQVGVLVKSDGATLFFSADHTMSQAWFLEDAAAGRLTNVGAAARKRYAQTNQRILELLAAEPIVLAPTHDPDAPRRLRDLEPVDL